MSFSYLFSILLCVFDSNEETGLGSNIVEYKNANLLWTLYFSLDTLIVSTNTALG